MRKPSEAFIGLALVLIAGGAILFSVMMTLLGWDFTRLDTRKFEQESITKEADIQKISIKAGTADVRITESTDGKFHVDFNVLKSSKREVTVDGDTLTISYTEDRKWNDFIFTLKSPKITVAVPGKQYELLKVNSSTGNLTLESGFMFDTVDIIVSTSEVSIGELKSTDVSIRTSTGDVTINGLTADTVTIKGSTSDIELKTLTIGKSISIETSTGDVDCFFTHDVNVDAKASTGRVKTDSSQSGVPCKIRTSTGDITVKKE